MSEAFINTLKRDYVDGADCSSAETVIRQLPGWIEDYERKRATLRARAAVAKTI